VTSQLSSGGNADFDLEGVRAELERRLAEAQPARWHVDPDDAQRSVGRLVLTLVEFIRQLLERQVMHRMDAETLTEEEIERAGLALMRLEETVRELAERFGIGFGELNLDLGPLGRLI
jgi:hypothetical protein